MDNIIKFNSTLLHELAHHWFGNIVTMKWWDDLWLNEGFAQYMAYLAIDKCSEVCKSFAAGSWVHHLTSSKNDAMKMDAQAKSHPVKVPVLHSD